MLLLAPHDGALAPRPVDLKGYFSVAALDRAQEYSGGQLWFSLLGLACQALLLIWLVWRPPGVLARSTGRRPLVATAGVGAGLSAAVTLAGLPASALARRRAVDIGLATASWGGWAEDVVRELAVGGVLAGIGGILAVALIRRAPTRWWLPGTALVVAGGVAFTFAGPVVLDPLANDFKPLHGQARADVLALARAAHVNVGDVLVVDASRRTSAANAYVTGFGRTKRVVVYDTLLRRFPRAERRVVLAHELGHVRHHDVRRGLLYLLLVAPLGLLAAARLTDALSPRGPDRRPGPGVLPALVLSLALVGLPIGWIANQLSRQVEAGADAFALRLTADPDALIAFERRITLQNVSDPDPPPVAQWLFGTHPTTRERIGAGLAFRAGDR